MIIFHGHHECGKQFFSQICASADIAIRALMQILKNLLILQWVIFGALRISIRSSMMEKVAPLYLHGQKKRKIFSSR